MGPTFGMVGNYPHSGQNTYNDTLIAVTSGSVSRAQHDSCSCAMAPSRGIVVVVVVVVVVGVATYTPLSLVLGWLLVFTRPVAVEEGR